MSEELSTVTREVLDSSEPVFFVCRAAKENRCPKNYDDNEIRCDLCTLLDTDQKLLPEILEETSCRTQRLGILNSRVITFCNTKGLPEVILFYDGESGGMVTLARL